jgi:sulfane dehydrogenase subunit SoxC
LQGPILPWRRSASARPWNWKRRPRGAAERATDDKGMVQPSRDAFVAERGLRGVYHYNAIASWRVDEKGEATNVYA